MCPRLLGLTEINLYSELKNSEIERKNKNNFECKTSFRFSILIYYYLIFVFENIKSNNFVYRHFKMYNWFSYKKHFLQVLIWSYIHTIYYDFVTCRNKELFTRKSTKRQNFFLKSNFDHLAIFYITSTNIFKEFCKTEHNF